VSNVYFNFALEPIWIVSFSPALLNGIWILLSFTAWCSLFDDQSSAIILWVLYIVSIVLNLVRCKSFVLILPLVSRSSCSGYAVFCCNVLSCIVLHIYTFKPYEAEQCHGHQRTAILSYPPAMLSTGYRCLSSESANSNTYQHQIEIDIYFIPINTTQQDATKYDQIQTRVFWF
jgi:hypothetical protein